MDRKARSHLHQSRSPSRDAQNRDFFNLPTSEALLPERRKQLYPPTVALSLFMCQTLEVNDSCQKAVRR